MLERLLSQLSRGTGGMTAMPQVWFALAASGPDAIGWAGLPHDASMGCIDPPPFGRRRCALRNQSSNFNLNTIIVNSNAHALGGSCTYSRNTEAAVSAERSLRR